MSDQSTTDALIGRALGACRIERRLGAGGMSAIYLAQQERPRRQVAVKVLRPQALTDIHQWPLFLARFRREADATAALDHANIVPIYAFGEENDLAYLIMPYLPDGSLADLLAREGPLPIPRALAYIDQIASALDYAHQHGIVHRDVKPSNLLLHPDGRLLLADFGIARPLDEGDLPDVALNQRISAAEAGLTVSGATLGTPDYMSPEQIRGERVGPATDIYALGVVTWATLTGRPPFGGGPTAEVLARQLNDAPPPLRTVRPDVSPRMEEAVFWALAKDPRERPATAGAYARAVREGARGTFGSLLKRAAGAGTALASLRGPNEALEPVEPPVARYGLATSADATLWDPSYHGGAAQQSQFSGSGGAGGAAWPRPRAGAAGPRPGGVSPAMMVAVALALVVLIVMGVMVGSALGNSLGSSFTTLIPAAKTATPRFTPTPTVTPSPTPSPTPVPPANWLSLDQDSVTLGCQKNQKSQYVRLTNQGDQPLGWQAQVPDFFPGVSVSPHDGTLNAGRSVNIKITNTTTFGSRQGQITFTPTSDQAGNPATLNYSTSACLGG